MPATWLGIHWGGTTTSGGCVRPSPLFWDGKSGGAVRRLERPRWRSACGGRLGRLACSGGRQRACSACSGTAIRRGGVWCRRCRASCASLPGSPLTSHRWDACHRQAVSVSDRTDLGQKSGETPPGRPHGLNRGPLDSHPRERSRFTDSHSPLRTSQETQRKFFAVGTALSLTIRV